MNNKTFKELYEATKSLPTPRQAFIADVARITCKNEQTVRIWLMGKQKPDELACNIIAQHFGVDPQGLFPRQN